MPMQHAAMLNAGELVVSPGVKPKTDTGERLEDQVLRAVGQHRDEDEDGEPPRLGFGPDFEQALRGRWLARRRGPAGAVAAGSSTPQTRKQREHQRGDTIPPETATSRAGENGSSK